MTASVGRVLLAHACQKRTQRAIARETGVSTSAIGDVIHGRCGPTLRHALAFRDRLGISIDAWAEEKSAHADADPARLSIMTMTISERALQQAVAQLANTRDPSARLRLKGAITELLDEIVEPDLWKGPRTAAHRGGLQGVELAQMNAAMGVKPDREPPQFERDECGGFVTRHRRPGGR